MDEPIIYVNGEFVPESKATISVLDHAVLYGDGVFETAVAWDGRVFKLDAHIERGFRSMAAISLQSPVDRETMKRLVTDAVKRNELRNAYIKWIMTRGSNGKPLMDPTDCIPNLIILTRPYIHKATADRLAKGLRMKTVAVRRPPGQVLDAHIKSLNYLNLVFAKLEAKSAKADEALLLDMNGRVCEATGCNVFVVHGGLLRTPYHDILEGITRETVFELAAELGRPVKESDLELYDVYTADEVFLTSSAGGILPVSEVDGRVIGKGVPGPISLELVSAYQRLLESDRHGTLVYDEDALPKQHVA
jgi:branched-chain amino acid aminotransferase